MGKIKVLLPEVRSKIAAGEVILRPSSVVKELIENSIDARAKRIEIEIEEGGKKKIIVNDDGIGMSREDAVLSIERFTTSKIEKFEDIENVLTFGFRGEALASIVQVAQFEMETSDGIEGTKIEAIDAKDKIVTDFQRPQGTRIKVSNLFYNLPARRKFLKSPEYERRLIVDTVRTYALIFPEIHFLLDEAGRNILNLSVVQDIKMRIRQIYGQGLVEKLLQFKLSVGAVSFEGFLSSPDFLEENDLRFTYVNHRPVKYPKIYWAILDAYQNPKTPPAFLLTINVEPRLLDVNVHPTKNEVRFKDDRYIIDLLIQGIKRDIFATHRRVDYGDRVITQEGTTDARFVQERFGQYIAESLPVSSPAKESSEFWQLHNTYILAQTGSGLIIVDQHVAHERIIYEALLSEKYSNQRLLFPITIELNPDEYEVYQKTKEKLKSIGIEFKEFSARTLVIEWLPLDVKISREDLKGFFGEIKNLGDLMFEKKELAKVVACRMAIKAGQKLSQVEMQSLIDRLFACENPYICPHGRPIVIKFTLDELAKKFGR
uniref:DNA mismatch repair protein MutL n=1 Tax=candidate division WOR-3 bacterium TaxID=2052148 RepID=A0A7C4TAS8_UNCW3